MKERYLRIGIVSVILLIIISIFAFASFANTDLSTEMIAWGFTRGKDNNQPNLDIKALNIINKLGDYAIGNSEKKYVYLTFDAGYEAGYTESILKTLKENEVTAAFFLTAHYINTAENLVIEMIKNGNIVGNHISVNSMYHQEKSYES